MQSVLQTQLFYNVQDLKTANFNNFFADTRDACNRLGDKASDFFELLTSQLLQRLLKSASGTKGAKLNTSYLQKFITELVEFGVRSNDEESERHELAQNIQVLLDPSSIPSKITEATKLIEACDHWLAKAFALDTGRKVLKAASEHADQRSEVEQVLTKVEDALSTMNRFKVEVATRGQHCTSSWGKQSLCCN